MASDPAYVDEKLLTLRMRHENADVIWDLAKRMAHSSPYTFDETRWLAENFYSAGGTTAQLEQIQQRTGISLAEGVSLVITAVRMR